ncbi:hypothetical protein H7U32_03165 [Bifidobacterium pullorum subsp. saeculare]|uniref:Secreted protein n=2 Tax=Bifidobacterium pullorum TaxID=78448 RepID=A0A939B9Y7_9BIFI|nr:hypothetical protein [Bifidobacterium pullorum subsp. saeculare]
MRKGMTRICSLAACVAMALSLSACGDKATDEPEYADETAMSVIAEGFEKRSDKIDELVAKNEDTSTTKNRRLYVQTELDNDKPLKDARFKDSQMQEDVISYINKLEDTMTLLKTSSPNSDDFASQWSSIYDERSKLLKKFVDDYGLTVGEQYQDSLDELLVNGADVAENDAIDEAIRGLVSGVTFEKTDDGYGSFTYSAVIQNTTNYDFSDVGILLALYDAQGVKVEETYANTSSWRRGESVRFEAFSSTDAATMKPSVDYYDVAD